MYSLRTVGNQFKFTNFFSWVRRMIYNLEHHEINKLFKVIRENEYGKLTILIFRKVLGEVALISRIIAVFPKSSGIDDVDIIFINLKFGSNIDDKVVNILRTDREMFMIWPFVVNLKSLESCEDAEKEIFINDILSNIIKAVG